MGRDVRRQARRTKARTRSSRDEFPEFSIRGMRLEDLDLAPDPPKAFHGKYTTPRGQLAAFLTDLDPLFRKLLTGDGLSGFDNIDYLNSESDRWGQFTTAEREHFRLLRKVCAAGPANAGAVNGEFLDNALRETILYEAPKNKPGRRRQRLDRSSDIAVSREADRVAKEMEPAFTRVRAIRKRGGFQSGPKEIRETLRAEFPI
jgi:hypothetical protein